MRHRLGLACGVLVVGVSVVAGCGEDEPPPDQIVFFLGLSQATGARCTSARSFGVPDVANPAANRNVIFGDGNPDVRLEDGGDDLVECRVAESGGAYDVTFELSSGEIGNLGVTGTAVAGVGGTTLNVNFQTRDFFLGQEGCTGDVEFIKPGALWVRNLTCPALTDPSSPGVSCNGNGGFIIENCSN